MKSIALFLFFFPVVGQSLTLHLSEGASLWAKRNKVMAESTSFKTQAERNEAMGQILGSEYQHDLNMGYAINHLAENMETISILRTSNTWKGGSGSIEQFYFAADGSVVKTETKIPAWLSIKDTKLTGKSENGTPILEFKYQKLAQDNSTSSSMTERHASVSFNGATYRSQRFFSAENSKQKIEIKSSDDLGDGLRLDLHGQTEKGDYKTATRFLKPHLNPNERTIGYYTDADIKLLTIVTSQNRSLTYKIDKSTWTSEKQELYFELDKIKPLKGALAKTTVKVMPRQTTYTSKGRDLEIQGTR
jgi:hypothetical protein